MTEVRQKNSLLYSPKGKITGTENKSAVSGAQNVEKGLVMKEHRELWGVIKMLYIFIVVVAT